MKSLIATALLLASVSTFAAESAVDTFLSVLPLGSHSGVDDKGNACKVTVSEANFPAKAISVQAENADLKIFKVINDASEFMFRGYKKEFIQTDRYYVDSTRNSYVDRVVRTVVAGDELLYVVVANEITVNRDRKVELVECVVNL
ncbi:hypothetical protein DOM21_15410 [Bacteriovorax stolpii]|uniref:Uncharacterized protein n=1 Tax=Bacteriovorax stolpii TaxID=960 RepID=A0A2K9NP01_BACTC|nr:hypothetical protein [Bacteriovorax stolpii]AUN97249.1 hypothetical protein C0V70_03815 [Bacteriovorax stolpii]QDK42812.1 hypothetical protein DOM21_15410 [Bacteriovorax stolpii]TDP53536.1 hypothetical protein C8D79_2183 [Bacteriovorax stolpii]